ncbi:MAG: nuclear transport factor 2 family protein [Gemmatimonadales bacterium]
MSDADSPAQRAKRLAVQFLDRVWGPSHELGAIDELMTPDYVITSGGHTIRGRNACKDWVAEFQRHLHDARTRSVEPSRPA